MLGECERGTMIPVFTTTFGECGPSADFYFQRLPDVDCSTDFLDLGVWLRTAKQCLSCGLVRGRDIVTCHYHKSIARSAGRDVCDNVGVY